MNEGAISPNVVQGCTVSCPSAARAQLLSSRRLSHPQPQQRCCLPAPQVLLTQLEAKQAGFSDVVYLDAKSDTYLEEVSSCNIFAVTGKTLRTPPLSGTILPGGGRGGGGAVGNQGGGSAACQGGGQCW